MSARTNEVCECFYKVLNIVKPSLSSYYLEGRAKMTKNYVLLKNHFERIKTTFEVEEYELITQLLDKAILVLNDESTERAYRRFGKEDLCLNWLAQQQHCCQSVVFVIKIVENLFAFKYESSSSQPPVEDGDDNDVGDNDNDSQRYQSLSAAEDERVEQLPQGFSSDAEDSQQQASSTIAMQQEEEENEQYPVFVDNKNSNQSEQYSHNEADLREEEDLDSTAGINGGAGSSRGSGRAVESNNSSAENYESPLSASQDDDDDDDDDLHQTHNANNSSSTPQLDKSLPKNCKGCSSDQRYTTTDDINMSSLLQEHVSKMNNMSLNSSGMTQQHEGPSTSCLFFAPVIGTSLSKAPRAETSTRVDDIHNQCKAAAHEGLSGATEPENISHTTARLPLSLAAAATSGAAASSSKPVKAKKGPFESFRVAKSFFYPFSRSPSSDSSSSQSSLSDKSVSADEFSLRKTSDESNSSCSSKQGGRLTVCSQREDFLTSLIIRGKPERCGQDDVDSEDRSVTKNATQVSARKSSSSHIIVSIENYYTNRGKAVFVCKTANGSGKTKREYSIKLVNMEELLKGQRSTPKMLRYYIRKLRNQNKRKYKSLMRLLPEKYRVPSKHVAR